MREIMVGKRLITIYLDILPVLFFLSEHSGSVKWRGRNLAVGLHNVGIMK